MVCNMSSPNVFRGKWQSLKVFHLVVSIRDPKRWGSVWCGQHCGPASRASTPFQENPFWNYVRDKNCLFKASCWCNTLQEFEWWMETRQPGPLRQRRMSTVQRLFRDVLCPIGKAVIPNLNMLTRKNYNILHSYVRQNSENCRISSGFQPLGLKSVDIYLLVYQNISFCDPAIIQKCVS